MPEHFSEVLDTPKSLQNDLCRIRRTFRSFHSRMVRSFHRPSSWLTIKNSRRDFIILDDDALPPLDRPPKHREMTTRAETHQHSRVCLPLMGKVVNLPPSKYQRSEKRPLTATTLRQHKRRRSRHNSVAGKAVGRRRRDSLKNIPLCRLSFAFTLVMTVLRSSSLRASATGFPSRHIRSGTSRASSAFVIANYQRYKHNIPASSSILNGQARPNDHHEYQTKGTAIGLVNHLKPTINVATRRMHTSTRLHANNGHVGANHILEVGDTVELVHDGALRTGVIAESRGSGWFTVKLLSQNSRGGAIAEDSIIAKKRRSQLTLVTGSGMDGQPIARNQSKLTSSLLGNY